jgi:hypothetical protein
VVNFKIRIIYASTDFSARLEDIHRASDGNPNVFQLKLTPLTNLDWPLSMLMSAEFEYQLRPLHSVDLRLRQSSPHYERRHQHCGAQDPAANG